MADEDFEKKQPELVNSDSLGGFLGIKHSAQYYTKAGVSSLYSDVYFLNDVKEDDLLELDLPPKAPSFITRVCGFGFHILRFHFGQARHARSLQIAQAPAALVRVFDCPAMSAV